MPASQGSETHTRPSTANSNVPLGHIMNDASPGPQTDTEYVAMASITSKLAQMHQALNFMEGVHTEPESPPRRRVSPVTNPISKP